MHHVSHPHHDRWWHHTKNSSWIWNTLHHILYKHQGWSGWQSESKEYPRLLQKQPCHRLGHLQAGTFHNTYLQRVHERIPRTLASQKQGTHCPCRNAWYLSWSENPLLWILGHPDHDPQCIPQKHKLIHDQQPITIAAPYNDGPWTPNICTKPRCLWDQRPAQVDDKNKENQ